MTPLLALFVLVRQTGPITFLTAAAPFSKVCDQLAKQSDLVIAPRGDLTEEVVAIDVHNMARTELVSRLAHVLYAKATLKDDKWVFVGDSVAARARQKKALEDRIKNIKHAQAAVLAEVDSEGAFDPQELAKRLGSFSKRFEAPNSVDRGDEYKAFEEIRRDGPGSRAVRRLVSQLPADILAEMAGGDVLIFSDRPRRYQLPLGPEASQCIAEASTDQNAWAASYQSDGTFGSRGWWRSGDPRVSTDPIDPSKVRLFLKATMQADSNLPSFEAELANADGVVLLNTTCNMQSDAKPEPVVLPVALEGEKALSLGPLGKAQVIAYRKGPYNYVQGAEGEARNWILNPEEFEPLGGAVSEAIIGSAEARHKSLVACVPDEAFNLMYTFGSNAGEMWPYKPSGVLSTIAKMSAQVEEDDTCIEIRGSGTDPRTDRAALGRFTRQEDGDGCMRLLPLIQFAGMLRANEWNSVAWQAVDPIAPSALEMAEIPEWLPLRLLGHLPPEQLATLAGGQPVRIDSLPEYVQDGIRHAVFYRNTPNLVHHFSQRGNPRGHLTLENEATEILPDGIWRDAFVSLTSTTTLAVAVVQADRSSTPMSMNEFAIHNLAVQNNQYQFLDRLQGQSTPGVHLNHRTRYILHWQLSPQISIDHILTDNDCNLRNKPTLVSALPDEYRKQLAAETAQVQKQYPVANLSLTRVFTSPPPR